ncbi:large conductance mechanosensitive channel protein MscL [Carnobacteriaceae bacterium zg-ZUI252]|nr:large conductance mechanosensitive channel protein MscL [Carnobacteriaceae bacterium zg-ZUI252]QTU83190.1 large conductance mechanosensitive channel protein MscL [Carnobacteriaceae bacterium zg-C25]
MLKELKAFLLRGNILELGVAVIIGGAFGAIVTSFVKDIISPLIALLFGQPDFSAVMLGTLKIGSFINAVINFAIVGTVLFFVMKAAEKVMPKKAVEEAAPAGPTQEELLAEIRDLLKSK